ncbi:hypothetical protein [Nocardioides salarius]|uniref:hypothetical protein n=1 Tax=Nocardioides salarius TaxID=374513 RepID=UPI0030F54664
MNPVTGLSLGRIAIGAAALARPDLVTRMFGVDVAANPQAGFVARLFGSREVALGVATLAASGRGRTGLVLLGVGVDLADAVAGHLAPREQGLEVLDARVMSGVASGAVLSGLLGLRTGPRGRASGPVPD